MFERCTKTVKQNPLKDANFLPIYVYVHNMCVSCVYTLAEADVPKPS